MPEVAVEMGGGWQSQKGVDEIEFEWRTGLGAGVTLPLGVL